MQEDAMQRHAASWFAFLALVAPAGAQEDAAARPAAKAWRVALSYETADDPRDMPVRSVGFYLSLGRRFKLKKLDDQDICEAELAYAGQALRFRVEDCYSTEPELRFDRTGATAWEQVDLLAKDRYLHRQESYLQTMLPPLNEKLASRKLRLICVTHEGRKPYAFLGDRGVWSGTLVLGTAKLKLIVYDKDADGDIGNDKLMLDADGDGKISRVERVGNGETILMGERAVTLRISRAGPASVEVTVGPRAGAEGRDVLAELKKAPVVGNVMPVFQFTDQRGKLVSSRALRGKVLLVNFWGVW
jgi:hypothetical protein